MISYKGCKCYYLGLNRWKVRIDDQDITFDILVRKGIIDLICAINRWRQL